MGEYKRYATLIGSALLAFLVIFLCSSPQALFGTVSFIDTELSNTSGSKIPVTVRMDLGKEEQLKDFPLQIGEWSGVDHETAGVKESLGADVLLMRTYTKANSFQPVFLLVMQSSSRSSFHPPVVCYPALGYEIEEEGKEKVYVTDTAWVKKPVAQEEMSKLPKWAREELESSPYSGLVSVKKLVVFKQNKGEVTERRVVLHFYIKDKMATSDKISMVRVSALAPPSGPYDDALIAAKELMGEAIPLMFEPHEKGKMFITYLAEWGIGGYFVILLLFSIPIAIITYPKVVARRNSSSNTGQK